MASISDLVIKPQSGASGSYFATWKFETKSKTTTTTTPSSSSIKVGSLVSIKSGATYYNGVAIPSWVKSRKWYVLQVSGDRAVIDKDESKTYSICSPIKVSNLVGGTTTSGTTTTTTTVTQNANEVDHYEVTWYYDTGDGVWFKGNSSTDVKETYNLYNAPSNAINIKVTVKPVAKTRKVNGTDTAYWTGTATTVQYSISSSPPEKPSTPSVEVDKYKLTASIENISDARSDEIEFQIYTDTALFKSGVVTVQACRASYSCTISAGDNYRVRARSININSSSKVYSEWTEFSGAVTTIPSAPTSITTCRANSETSVYLEWGKVDTAKTYDVEYAIKKEYFDASDQTSTKTGIEFNNYIISGLESGQEYFFRVRAVNEKGGSDWSEIASVSIGKKPAAPTTWSSTTTGITGETVTLYWVHNAEDGSNQTYAELEIYIGSVKQTHTIKAEENSGDSEENSDKIHSYPIDTSNYIEGTKIRWRVRTAGVTKEYGDWSIERTIDIYTPPTLTGSITDIDNNVLDTVTSFPFYFYGLPGPKTQTPIGYQLTITANESYVAVDRVGNEEIVNAGGIVYSKYFDIKEELLVEFSPYNIDLESGISYTATCVVSMNSGLTATSTSIFRVSWTDVMYEPNAEIGYDETTFTTHIHPYCIDSSIKYYKVEYSSDIYSASDEIDGETINPVYTITGEQVYMGVNELGLERYYGIINEDELGNPISPVYYEIKYSAGSYNLTNTVIDISKMSNVLTDEEEIVLLGRNELGDEIYYCAIETTGFTEGISLSVYRREFDGSFTELATGLDNTRNTFITDPHPALDYARYRVVAITDSTGAVSYHDIPPYPIREIAVIIQWDEKWSNFDTTESNEQEQPSWTGSLLRLPYNIDVSDSNDLDVTLVNYIGRKRPVSYYGTHLGEKSTWNVDIPKSDKETLYALRRLAIWAGDVYVREPSGSGYWANISVSFSQKHCEVKIPVTFSITRVEGGA